ncbi:MAG: response regulator [Pseudomonadota bacterium]
MPSVLIIDDEASVRFIFRRVLESKGFEVIEASDGEMGLRMYRENPVDVVVTDIIMPVKDGAETISEFRSEFPNGRIIAISGGGLAIAGNTCLTLAKAMGANLTMTKPVDADELAEAVRSLLTQ